MDRGVATAIQLLVGGASILLVDFPTSLKAAEVDERLMGFLSAGAVHLHPVTDLAEEGEMEAYVKEAVSLFGGLDIAIFAAVTVQVWQDFLSISAEEYDETVSRSVRAG
jgi:NAD(P)-dependent dehydrogenase (short-subunit alcohol dehydrogenase family)